MNMIPLYVKTEDVPVTRTRKDFIRKFLRGQIIPSYTDPECKKLQCDGKGEDKDSKGMAYRSVTELHALTCGRFPVTSLKAIVKILSEIMEEDQTVILVWCKMISKVVVKYAPNKGAKWMSDYSLGNYLNVKGVDGYSLKDFHDIKQSL